MMQVSSTYRGNATVPCEFIVAISSILLKQRASACHLEGLLSIASHSFVCDMTAGPDRTPLAQRCVP